MAVLGLAQTILPWILPSALCSHSLQGGEWKRTPLGGPQGCVVTYALLVHSNSFHFINSFQLIPTSPSKTGLIALISQMKGTDAE